MFENSPSEIRKTFCEAVSYNHFKVSNKKLTHLEMQSLKDETSLKLEFLLPVLMST